MRTKNIPKKSSAKIETTRASKAIDLSSNTVKPGDGDEFSPQTVACASPVQFSSVVAPSAIRVAAIASEESGAKHANDIAFSLVSSLPILDQWNVAPDSAKKQVKELIRGAYGFEGQAALELIANPTGSMVHYGTMADGWRCASVKIRASYNGRSYTFYQALSGQQAFTKVPTMPVVELQNAARAFARDTGFKSTGYDYDTLNDLTASVKDFIPRFQLVSSQIPAPTDLCVQRGETCKLVALANAMMFSYHAKRDSALSAAIPPPAFANKNPEWKGRSLRAQLKELGSSVGEVYNTHILQQLAERNGYTATVSKPTSTQEYMLTIMSSLRRATPVIVFFDIDLQGLPDMQRGTREHAAVIVGCGKVDAAANPNHGKVFFVAYQAGYYYLLDSQHVIASSAQLPRRHQHETFVKNVKERQWENFEREREPFVSVPEWDNDAANAHFLEWLTSAKPVASDDETYGERRQGSQPIESFRNVIISVAPALAER